MAWARENKPKLKLPYFDNSDGDKGHFLINTIEEKIIFEYSGYDFDRIEKLELFEYWLLLRDAVIYKHSQTEEGLEYLEKCWILEQTSPDRKKLREKVGEGVK